VESNLNDTFREKPERWSSLPAPDRGVTSPHPTSRTTTKVIVVEDECVVAKDLCGQLAELGVEVVGTASSAETAIRLVEHWHPDLVLMDIHLKGKMDGIDAAAEIREKFDVPTVYVTAHSDDGTLRRARGTEPLGYLVKPLSQRDLHVTLDMAFERCRMDRERARLLADMHTARLEAEQANRAKDEFLATLSHELRSPMQAILGWAAVLEQGNVAAERGRHAAGVISRNARHELELIDDLLDASRILAGKFQIDLEPIDLRALVQETVDALTPSALAQSLSLTCQFEEACFVNAHPRSLRQVFTNLLTNAIKFSAAGGKIEVQICSDGDWVSVVIRDYGEGIDPGVLPHVFERFRQGDGSTTRKSGGLGLGLAIAKHVVEVHGATIEAASSGIGCGSTFTVRLRRVAAISRPSVLRSQHDALAGASVLVVDDSRDVLDFLAFVLSEHGATVHLAVSASEAIAVFAECEPEIVITDLSMPGWDGFSLLRHLRTLGRPLRTVLLTGYADFSTRQRALDAGFDVHLSKPIDPDELVRAVARLRAQRDTERSSV
jgi:signal transduction histidine kinase